MLKDVEDTIERLRSYGLVIKGTEWKSSIYAVLADLEVVRKDLRNKITTLKGPGE